MYKYYRLFVACLGAVPFVLVCINNGYAMDACKKAQKSESDCEISLDEDAAIIYGYKLYTEGKYLEAERFVNAVISGGGKNKGLAYVLKMAASFKKGEHENVVEIGREIENSIGMKINDASVLTKEQKAFFSFIYKMSYGYSLSILDRHRSASEILQSVTESEVKFFRNASVYFEVLARSCMRAGVYKCAKERYYELIEELRRINKEEKISYAYYNLACNESLNGDLEEVAGFLDKTNFNKQELHKLVVNDSDFKRYVGSRSYSVYFER